MCASCSLLQRAGGRTWRPATAEHVQTDLYWYHTPRLGHWCVVTPNTTSQNAPVRIWPLAFSFEPILTLHAIPYWYHYRRCRETGSGCPRPPETQLHNPSHCFEETRDGPYLHTHSDLRLICCSGTLNVTHVRSPFFLPRSLFGLFHILFAHFRQLYLVLHLLFVAKSVTSILLTYSRPVFRLSGCSSIVVWSSTATSPIICWQMEST